MPLRVRPAEASDIDELARLDRLAFGDHAYSLSVTRQFLELFPTMTLLAVDGGGTARAFCFGGLGAGAETGWILALGVDPAHRRGGYGSAVTREQLRRMREAGARTVRLSCAPDAAGALAFYVRLGFTAVERIDDFLGPGRHRLILECQLVELATRNGAIVERPTAAGGIREQGGHRAAAHHDDEISGAPGS
jgi:[ribosomal protein S18]-alanine N-acetyltransferase